MTSGRILSWYVASILLIVAMLFALVYFSQKARADGMPSLEFETGSATCSYGGGDEENLLCTPDEEPLDMQMRVAAVESIAYSCPNRDCTDAILVLNKAGPLQSYKLVADETSDDRQEISMEDALTVMAQSADARMVPVGHRWYGAFKKSYEQQLELYGSDAREH